MFLTHLTSSPHFYTYLYIAILLLAALNVFEVVFLLLHKLRREKAEAKKEALKRRIAAAIITVAEPAGTLPEPKTLMEYEAYSETAASIIESFDGEIAGRASRLISIFGIDSYYRSLLNSRIWFKRAHAIDSLSSLKLEKNREFFNAVFESETSKEVKYRIIYGLSLLVRTTGDIYLLSKMLAALPYLTAKYTEDIFFNILTVFKNAGREEEFGLFLRQIMTDLEIPVKMKRDCLSACHAAGCERSGVIVREYYKAFLDEPEVVIACIRTLVGLGDFDILKETLRHKDWRVRLAALKYAHLGNPDIRPDHETLLHNPDFHFAVLPGVLRHKDWRARLTNLKHAHLHSSEILRELKPLLRDPNYHIRLNSALALSRFGAPGLEILREEAASTDKYAAAAAKYALDGAGAAL